MLKKQARSISIYNLIPLLSGNAKDIQRLQGRPDKVLNALRESCEYKAQSMAQWRRDIERHCPVPLSHPYRKFSDRLPASDPLRTLGCWAYGAGNSWITIEEIAWQDGAINRPQDEHRKWLKTQSAGLLEDSKKF